MTRPPITSTTHTLPFDKLSPRGFEQLCLWLVEREGYERAEHLGAASSQQGRDIVAWHEGALWAFQCKRLRSFGPSDALAEVGKVLALPAGGRAPGGAGVPRHRRHFGQDAPSKRAALVFWRK